MLNKIKTLIFGTTALAITSCSDGARDPKADVQAMADFLYSFAIHMLETQKAFAPFGVALSTSGEQLPLDVTAGNPDMDDNQLVAILESKFKKGADDGEYIATALAYNVSAVSPYTNSKVDGIAVKADHLAGYSGVIIYPYTITDNGVEFGQTWAQPGDGTIFNALNK